MSDYTPKTEMVKTRYAIGHGGLSDDEEDVRADAFDRWLAEHDRQVAERAWDEGQKAGLLRADFEYGAIGYQHVRDNPYREWQGNE